MKRYKVTRHFINHAYGSSWSAFTTCVKDFDTFDEALKTINDIRARFPESYITYNGNLARKVKAIVPKEVGGITVDVIEVKRVFWTILEHGDDCLLRPVFIK